MKILDEVRKLLEPDLLIWPEEFLWPHGTPPVLSTKEGEIDTIILRRSNGKYYCTHTKDLK